MVRDIRWGHWAWDRSFQMTGAAVQPDNDNRRAPSGRNSGDGALAKEFRQAESHEPAETQPQEFTPRDRTVATGLSLSVHRLSDLVKVSLF